MMRIHPFQNGNGRVGRLIMFKECLKYNIVPFKTVYGNSRLLFKTGIEISYIQRDLITVIFYYQISLKPLKTLSLSQVSFPLLFPLYYIVP